MNEYEFVDARQALVEEAQRAPLSDIIIAGFVDDCDSGKIFHPMLNDVYVKVGQALFMLSSAHQHSLLSVQQIDAIKCEFDIDEDDDFCICSITQMLFSAPYVDSGIQSVEWFQSFSRGNDAVILRAMGLLLEREEYVFFDPLNYFGVQVGGRDRRGVWLLQNPDATIKTSTIVK